MLYGLSVAVPWFLICIFYNSKGMGVLSLRDKKKMIIKLLVSLGGILVLTGLLYLPAFLNNWGIVNELNKFSYYNSFFRIKEELIKKGLITIENTSKVKTIKLTEKGLDIYNKLNEINEMVKN